MPSLLSSLYPHSNVYLLILTVVTHGKTLVIAGRLIELAQQSVQYWLVDSVFLTGAHSCVTNNTVHFYKYSFHIRKYGMY